MKITPTNRSGDISRALIQLFRDHYDGAVVRNIGVAGGRLQAAGFDQLDLLRPVTEQVNEAKIDTVLDDIRKKFDLTSLVKLSSIGQGGTMIDRAGLVGGHNGGNAFG